MGFLYFMRYHFTKPQFHSSRYGEVYKCNHPVYSYCTLYKVDNKGLAVIQQRFDPLTKSTWWESIDLWLVDLLYLNVNFIDFFNKYATKPTPNGLYFTVTLRQLMWALKMKPLKRERWETTFDHRDI